MAHFMDPSNGAPLSFVEIMDGGSYQVGLWGGGPGPDYADLTVAYEQNRAGAIHPANGVSIGNNTRLFTLSGRSAGGKLHAYLEIDDETGCRVSDYAAPVSTTRVDRFFRPPPIGCGQDHSKNECWACALQSWLAVTFNRPKLTKDELIAKHDPQHVGLREDVLRQVVMPQYQMDCKALRRSGPDTLRPSFLRETLVRKGSLYFLYQSGVQSAHALVVFGLAADPVSGEPAIHSMDPWYGSYNVRGLSQFDGKPLYVCWAK